MQSGGDRAHPGRSQTRLAADISRGSDLQREERQKEKTRKATVTPTRSACPAEALA
jgi:hypothetical protein